MVPSGKQQYKHERSSLTKYISYLSFFFLSFSCYPGLHAVYETSPSIYTKKGQGKGKKLPLVFVSISLSSSLSILFCTATFFFGAFAILPINFSELLRKYCCIFECSYFSSEQEVTLPCFLRKTCLKE